MIMRFVLPALALAFAAPVVAQSTSVAVPYGDLDLTKSDGRAMLDMRLDRASRQVCGGTAPVRDLQRMQAWRECLAEARAGYRDQVELALNAANARRVAVLADKLGVFASF